MTSAVSSAQDHGGASVTVILPVYQTEADLSECLESVCGQTLTDLQIIVVDDASTDDSLAIAQAVASTDKRVEILQQDVNRGPSAARNAGFQRAIGKYVFYLDSDDFIAANALAKLVALAEATTADVTFGRGQVFFENGRFGHSFPPGIRHELRGLDPARFIPYWVFMSAPLGLYKREFLAQHEICFDEDVELGEDRIFLSRCLPQARSISALGEEIYFYRRRKGSLSNYEHMDLARIDQFIRYNQRVGELYAAFPMVRQHYLLTFIVPQIERMVAVAHGGDADELRHICDGIAPVYKGLDMDLLRMPANQMWRPIKLVPRRYMAVVEALSAGNAEQLREAVIELASSHDTPEVVKARKLMATDPLQAMQLAEEETRRTPSNLEAQFVYATALGRLDRATKSISALVKAVEQAPDDPEIHQALCVAYMGRGFYRKAEEAIAHAVKTSPCEARNFRLMARVKLARGKPDAAVSAMRAATKLLPGSANSNATLARFCLEAGRSGDACEILNRMWKKLPDLQQKKQEYWILIGWLVARGEIGCAVFLLFGCPEPGKTSRVLNTRLASVLVDEYWHDLGENAAGRSLALGDALARAHKLLAAARSWSSTLAAAEAEVFSLPDNTDAPRRAAALCRLASSHGRIGLPWAAVRALRYAQELHPRGDQLGPIARRVSVQLERRGEFTAAIECLKVWQVRNPRRGEIQERIDELRSHLQCAALSPQPGD